MTWSQTGAKQLPEPIMMWFTGMPLCFNRPEWVNTLRWRQNFADDFLKCIFLNENVWVSLKISLKFVPNVRIYNITALVQIMDWRRPGYKPLSEPIMVSLPTHICVARPQWVNTSICDYPGNPVLRGVSCTLLISWWGNWCPGTG